MQVSISCLSCKSERAEHDVQKIPEHHVCIIVEYNTNFGGTCKKGEILVE